MPEPSGRMSTAWAMVNPPLAVRPLRTIRIEPLLSVLMWHGP